MQKKLQLLLKEMIDGYYYILMNISKAFLNNTKIACIPVIFHKRNVITDFQEKPDFIFKLI